MQGQKARGEGFCARNRENNKRKNRVQDALNRELPARIPPFTGDFTSLGTKRNRHIFYFRHYLLNFRNKKTLTFARFQSR
jgi:hypothetical protein